MEADSSPNTIRLETRWRFVRRAGMVYVVAVGLGVLVTLQFAPDVFLFSDLSGRRLLAAAVVMIFVVMPVVAAGYLLLGVVVEAAIMGTAWLCRAGWLRLTAQATQWFGWRRADRNARSRHLRVGSPRRTRRRTHF